VGDAKNHADRRFGDAGQALPLMALVVMVAVVAILALAQVGMALDDSARARTAADAAALAGAVDGRRGAQDMATINGGNLIEFVKHGDTVDVLVGVGRATARASADARVEWKARSGG